MYANFAGLEILILSIEKNKNVFLNFVMLIFFFNLTVIVYGNVNRMSRKYF